MIHDRGSAPRSASGKSAVEWIAIVVVFFTIVGLLTIYFQQSGIEAQRSRGKDMAEKNAKSITDRFMKDIANAKPSSLEINELSPTDTEVRFQVLDGDRLAPLVFIYNKDKRSLVRHFRKKTELLSDHLATLILNEDAQSGAIDVEVTADYTVEGDVTRVIRFTDRITAKPLDKVPQGLTIETDEGLEMAQVPEAAQSNEDSDVYLSLFKRYSGMSAIEIKKGVSDLEFQLKSSTRDEEAINQKLASETPGIDFPQYNVYVPGVRDVKTLDMILGQKGLDPEYKKMVEKKIGTLNDRVRVKREIKIAQDVLIQKEKSEKEPEKKPQ